MINAENNYYGAPSGPMHPDNPGGTGDAIVGVGSSNSLDFMPFLTEEACQVQIAIPTMSEWGLFILMLLVFITALVLLREKQKKYLLSK